MKLHGALWLFSILLFADSTYAEGNCPPGSYPIGGQGVQGCAPIPGYSQQQQGYVQPQPSPTPYMPPPSGIDDWGAIATDIDGHVMYVSAFDMQSITEQLVLMNCRIKYGHECKLLISFVGAYASVARGDDGLFYAGIGDSRAAAKLAARQRCEQSQTSCNVVETYKNLRKAH